MSKKRKKNDHGRHYAVYFRNSWLWGAPNGLSDYPEEFLEFLQETEGIQYIKATEVIRINDISEANAIRLVNFLRNAPLPVR